jgi:hypothetical protein
MATILCVLNVITNYGRLKMRGKLAKKLRKHCEHSLKRWRSLGIGEMYHLEKHEKVVWKDISGPLEAAEWDKVKEIAYQVWTRGAKRDYNLFKRSIKNVPTESKEDLYERRGL